MLEIKLSEDKTSYVAIENGQIINTCVFEIDGEMVKIVSAGNEDTYLFDGLIRATCAYARGNGATYVVFSDSVDKEMCVKLGFVGGLDLDRNEIKVILGNKKCQG